MIYCMDVQVFVIRWTVMYLSCCFHCSYWEICFKINNWIIILKFMNTLFLTLLTLFWHWMMHIKKQQQWFNIYKKIWATTSSGEMSVRSIGAGALGLKQGRAAVFYLTSRLELCENGSGVCWPMIGPFTDGKLFSRYFPPCLAHKSRKQKYVSPPNM